MSLTVASTRAVRDEMVSAYSNDKTGKVELRSGDRPQRRRRGTRSWSFDLKCIPKLELRNEVGTLGLRNEGKLKPRMNSDEYQWGCARLQN